MSKWKPYRELKTDRDGLWLVRLRNGKICLGEFYCQSFVMEGFGYNQTPGMISEITHLQLVTPPKTKIK